MNSNNIYKQSIFLLLMSFEQQKSEYLKKLGKPDRSRANSPDPQIMPLLDIINADERFYTTSSCAGRIMLIELPDGHQRNETIWHYVTHDAAELEQCWEVYNQLEENTQESWFKMDTLILHVCAENMDAAKELLLKAHQAGFTHSGIISLSKRIMIEIIDQQRVEALVIYNNKKLVDKEHLGYLIEKANTKLTQGRERMQKLIESLE